MRRSESLLPSFLVGSCYDVCFSWFSFHVLPLSSQPHHLDSLHHLSSSSTYIHASLCIQRALIIAPMYVTHMRST